MSSVVIKGDTSGQVTLDAPAVAGTVAVTLPSASGTMATTADITSAFSGANQSLTTNGYQKLPSGLILQWCESTAQSTETDATVTYPMTFPTAVLQVVVGTDVDSSPGDLICQLVSKTTSNCVVRFNSLGSPTSTKAVVFAIGY